MDSNDARAGKPVQNRTVSIVTVSLIIVLVAGYAIVKSSSSGTTSAVEPGMRAVIVPTADAARTVIVAPCGTSVSVVSRHASAVMHTTGSTALQLPRGSGDRVVLVPECGGGRGGSAGPSQLPSAAFVTVPGTPVPAIGSRSVTSSPQAGAPNSAQLMLTVPRGSTIRTIVLSPCQKARHSQPSQRVLSAAAGSSTAVAPGC